MAQWHVFDKHPCILSFGSVIGAWKAQEEIWTVTSNLSAEEIVTVNVGVYWYTV